MNKKRKEILYKIEKLMRLSKSDNEHEAELAMSRANKLMTEYQIDFGDLDIDDINKGRSTVEREIYEVKSKMTLIWINDLGRACAELYDGICVTNTKLHGNRFTFVGFPDDIPLMKATFEHLLDSWQAFVKTDLKDAKAEAECEGWRFQPRDTMKFKHGHGQGYASSIRVRVSKLVRERNKAVQEQNSSGSTSIVLVKRDAVKEDIKSWTTNVKQRQTAGDSSGRAAGAAAGQRVNLNGSLKGNAGTRCLT